MQIKSLLHRFSLGRKFQDGTAVTPPPSKYFLDRDENDIEVASIQGFEIETKLIWKYIVISR